MGIEEDNGRSVTTKVELSGKYDDIVDIMAGNELEYPQMSSTVADMAAVLDIVTRTGGATKSRIAAALPTGVATDLDAESVIHVLRVLELYDLVHLDGNTWRPGPALSTDQEGENA